MAYGDIDLGQHWLRWRHQSVTWTNDDFSLVRFCGIHLRVISQPKPMLLFCKWKIILLKLQPHLSGSSKVNLVSPVTTSWCSYVNSDCVQGSDQFMNWIGIDNQFNSIQHELNWNWIERFGIELELNESLNWSELINSINSFPIQLLILHGKSIFLYAILWNLQCDKQFHVSKHTHMLYCEFPVWGLQESLYRKGWPLQQLLWDISSALTH